MDSTQMLFSRVFPMDQKPEDTDIWKAVQSLGGKCTKGIGLHVTHLVSKEYTKTKKIIYAK